MHAGWKIAAILLGPRVGQKFDRNAARGERIGERFRGEQMAAGASGRDEDRTGEPHAGSASDCRKMISARGRLRITAARNPMPSAREITDEPPYEMNGNVMPLAGMR